LRKNIFAISLIIFWISFIISSVSFAVDKGGCMTCHRYPGLVKFNKPDQRKVLHIDEEKHLASRHAKTDCRQCHPKTVKIPHTDVTEVSCTDKCHNVEGKTIEALDKAYYTDFHKEERFAITNIENKTSCRVCHKLYPHSENNKVRAFLNMHTGFMLCEVCHLKKEGHTDLTYAWKAPEPFEFTGEPYGTHHKQKIIKPEKQTGIISKMLRILSDETDEETHEVRHMISRIAVYRTDGESRSLFMNTVDNPEAEKYLASEKTLTPKEKKRELDHFHRDIAKKDISIACDECHSQKSILDFRKLGFSKNRTYDLEFLNIKGMVTKYKTFYIPNLFGH